MKPICFCCHQELPKHPKTGETDNIQITKLELIPKALLHLEGAKRIFEGLWLCKTCYKRWMEGIAKSDIEYDNGYGEDANES